MFIIFTGSAVGFKLDSLLKLADTRASTSKMTLMHYLCKVCILFYFLKFLDTFEYAKIGVYVFWGGWEAEDD